MTSIEWTDLVWNPVRGCSRVSAGCDHCYAMQFAHARHSGPGKAYEGLTTKRNGRVDWTGSVRFVPEQLALPLNRRKPQRIFVNSMSDLFHESISNEEIAAVFGVMAACPQHTFQVLTKRPERAREWFKWVVERCADHGGCERDTLHRELYRLLPDDDDAYTGPAWQRTFFDQYEVHAATPGSRGARWPLPNVWLGVSAENQDAWNDRVPELVHGCPAALHFVSAEPLLGPIDNIRATARLHVGWVIVGGESGPGARPCNVNWIESLACQCRDAGIPVFVKQLGTRPIDPDRISAEPRGIHDVVKGEPTPKQLERLEQLIEIGTVRLQNRKGSDPSEWPPGLNVREFPQVSA